MRYRKLASIALGLAGLIVLAVLIWQGITQHGAPPDPSDPESGHLSSSMVVIDSGILVFREGLETILVLAGDHRELPRAPTRSTGGRSRSGAGAAIAAPAWRPGSSSSGSSAQSTGPALDVQAATGLLGDRRPARRDELVLPPRLLGRLDLPPHKRRRKRLLERRSGAQPAPHLLGLALLGFTSVYREGFEIVLFLQNLRLATGSGLVLEGVSIGLALTAIVGVLTFALHHRLPYKRMLVLTGVMLGVVLLVMVGEKVQEMQLAGWLPTTAIGLPIPDWVGLWFATFANVEGLVAQLIAALVVIGSYVVAQDVRVRRPRLRGETPAHRPEQPPLISGQRAAGSRQ